MSTTHQTNTGYLVVPSDEFQLQVAQQVNHRMELSMARELLASDLLNKVHHLYQLEKEILKQSPHAGEHTDFIIKCFCHASVRHLNF
ncbi:hypothetical protein NHG35_08445 [Aerococcaceae bacterium NML180378]|nr:hypothetical protein [Aerococcaceae bacterium NML180378]